MSLFDKNRTGARIDVASLDLNGSVGVPVACLNDEQISRGCMCEANGSAAMMLPRC